ncbi:MAG: TetR/AcrR family transcriptional regulator [Burkholderiales bacterium]
MSTSKRARHSYHHGDLPATLLRAAGQILEKEGVEAISMRALTRRTGVSHAAPYRHFPDREALLAALAAEGFVMLGGAQQAAAASGAAIGLGAAYVRFALDHPQRFRLMFGGRVPIAKHPALRQAAERTFDGIARALSARIPQAAVARDAAIAAWSLVHGLAHLMLDDRISASARAGRSEEEFVRQVLGAIRFAAGAAAAPGPTQSSA